MLKRSIKRAFAALLTLIVTLATFAGSSSLMVSASETISWNFKNSNFKSLGTISSTTTVDGLTLLATSSKTMSVKADTQTVGGTEYTYCLATGGSGSTSYRAVKVPVSGSDTIKVTMKSSGSDSRSLVVANSQGSALTKLTASSSAATVSYNYSGSSGYVYLYSENSGINIYKIQVDSNGSNSGSSSNLVSDGWYYLKNVNSQKYLDVTGDSDVNFANVDQENGLGDKSQRWYVTNKGNNVITLTNGMASARVLDVYYGGTTNGTNIDICDSNGSTAQQFNVVSTGTNGVYCLTTVCSGGTQAVDVYNWSTQAGGNIDTWEYNGLACQQFVFEPIGSSSDSSNTGSNSGSSSGSGSSSSVDTSDGTVVTSYQSLVSAISKAEQAGGGKVYVKGTSISCTGQIALSKTNAKVEIIGVQNSDGSYPVLDFNSFLQSYIGKATSDSAVGIRILGSYYTIKNLIVQKAPDNGIQIKGTSAGHNTVSNVVTRYNNDAGLQITAGAYSNKIEYVSSYRNCDVYTLGGNADGFAPKLGAGAGNSFYCCYAWDNSDDGWDSYDKSGDVTPDITYTQCACWNNGNPDVFTGKYDYDNGNALDTNLLLVQLIMKKDSSFASNYANKKFSLPTSNFIVTNVGTISISSWTGSNYDGNPNGFKMGSAYSTSSATRVFSHCLAFDNAKKGFDNNNSSVTGSFSNCVAFDNGYNYYIQPLSIKTWTNIYGFSGASSDKLPSGKSVTTPSSSNQSTIRSKVNSTKNSIISTCKSNGIPGAVYFNIY